MPLPRVLPDTNACYPISLLDLILRLDEAALHQVIWTEDLLEELARTWVDKGARSRESAEKICDDIRHGFTGQDVPRRDYEHLIAAMPGKDPDDHPHAAAAAARAPAIIITAKTADFPAEPLAKFGVSVRRPDDYLCGLLHDHPDDIANIIIDMAASRQHPPTTPPEILDALARAGAILFAARMRNHLSL